ncbi:hypothetical protein ADUPG1_003446, partial [Aduncisulcus paluster]
MTLGFLVEESMVEVVKPVLECFLTNESKASKKIPPLQIRIKKGELFKTRACRRIPRAHKEFLKQEIKTLLHDGIISDREGEFFSPIVIVPKKGGKLRLCIDFRDLNKVTTLYPHPLPRLDDCLGDLGGCIYFATLDLSKGFHQIPLENKSAD